MLKRSIPGVTAGAPLKSGVLAGACWLPASIPGVTAGAPLKLGLQVIQSRFRSQDYPRCYSRGSIEVTAASALGRTLGTYPRCYSRGSIEVNGKSLFFPGVTAGAPLKRGYGGSSGGYGLPPIPGVTAGAPLKPDTQRIERLRLPCTIPGVTAGAPLKPHAGAATWRNIPLSPVLQPGLH